MKDYDALSKKTIARLSAADQKTVTEELATQENDENKRAALTVFCLSREPLKSVKAQASGGSNKSIFFSSSGGVPTIQWAE